MVATVAYVLFIAVTRPWEGGDAHAYWMARGDLYSRATVGGVDAYLYSPAFAQLLVPLQALPWDAFHALWAAGTGLLLVAMAGPLALPLAFAPPVGQELWTLNVHLLMGAVIVVGFRYPAAWALILLTKVTPGIGLVWFAVRREWHHLGIALAATAAIVAVSFALAPDQWFAWVDALLSAGPATGHLIPIPLAPRLVAAFLIVAWGAHTNRRWTVPIAVTLALPALWWAGLAILVACIPLRR